MDAVTERGGSAGASPRSSRSWESSSWRRQTRGRAAGTLLAAGRRRAQRGRHDRRPLHRRAGGGRARTGRRDHRSPGESQGARPHGGDAAAHGPGGGGSAPGRGLTRRRESPAGPQSARAAGAAVTAAPAARRGSGARRRPPRWPPPRRTATRRRETRRRSTQTAGGEGEDEPAAARFECVHDHHEGDDGDAVDRHRSALHLLSRDDETAGGGARRLSRIAATWSAIAWTIPRPVLPGLDRHRQPQVAQRPAGDRPDRADPYAGEPLRERSAGVVGPHLQQRGELRGRAAGREGGVVGRLDARRRDGEARRQRRCRRRRNILDAGPPRRAACPRARARERLARRARGRGRRPRPRRRPRASPAGPRPRTRPARGDTRGRAFRARPRWRGRPRRRRAPRASSPPPCPVRGNRRTRGRRWRS